MLRSANLDRRLAATLQSFLEGVLDANVRHGRPGTYSLDYLRELSDEAVMDELLDLPGLKQKTARDIMNFTLGRAVLADDRQVRRVLNRMRLLPNMSGKVDRASYENLIPVKIRERLRVNLIHHGRATCKPKPRCTECSLISFCPTGQASLKPDKRPVAVEVFAGAGGLALGFAQAGFRVAVAVEKERNAAQTHRANHPGTVVLEQDVSKPLAPVIRAVAPWMGDVTAVIGGPPCQGYSIAGKRDPDDEQNELFKHQVRLAKELDARFVVIENVLGMRNIKGVSFTDAVEQELRNCGYNPRHRAVKASDYGVPQLRWRLIFTAQLNTKGNAPEVPIGKYCGNPALPCRCGRKHRAPTVREVLSRPGLPKLQHGMEAEFIPLADGHVLLNGSTMKHSQKVIEKIAGIEAGKGPISYRRLHKDLARTIVAGHRALPVHPDLNRTISVREAARIQGFPDEYVFCGTRGKQPLQVANAVPPLLARAVAEELIRVMERKTSDSAHKQHLEDLCGPVVMQLAFPAREESDGGAPEVVAS
ncbi:DNA-methyltransferase (dcm) [Actinomadura madurae]|uniref:DNA (cytosine-5-)-methyltransferase n=2 Tax=Actinomadura madurae TaxID=1993 RepID=A0A1I5VCJ5_9ACTN|nr:DNA-methyltransferase (dcm) [Actinomadura madurae]